MLLPECFGGGAPFSPARAARDTVATLDLRKRDASARNVTGRAGAAGEAYERVVVTDVDMKIPCVMKCRRRRFFRRRSRAHARCFVATHADVRRGSYTIYAR